MEPPVVLLALCIDAAIGDPPRLYRVLPHPVAAFGRAAALLEARLNRPGPRRAGRGAAMAAGLVCAAAAAGWAAERILGAAPWGWAAEALLASALVAWRGLHDAAAGVADGLDAGLDAARDRVRHIVGRDPESLDEAGVARAAIESAGENLGDGVVAPLFWFAALGLPGLCAYKAVNTLDSMIGHRAPRYAEFGRFAARLDDAANWLPARLAGALLCAVSGRRAAWRIMARDAAKHDSPNAGWPEAALAGALGLALAGPRRYEGAEAGGAWLGDGRRAATAADLRRAVVLLRRAGAALALLLAGLWLAGLWAGTGDLQ